MENICEYPIVQAPMAGGVSTPKLAAAVSDSGGLGFLAAGYKSARELEQEIIEMHSLTKKPFGVNLFVPTNEKVAVDALDCYQKELSKAAEYLECQVGIPKNDDDEWSAKLDIIQKHQVPAVSFTFGCPDREIVASLKGIGSRVFVTITTPQEAEVALRAGADALCLQGIEAGGHRSTFLEDSVDYPLMKLLKEVRSITTKPLIAAGGLMTGADIKHVLQEGASAAQLGTAFICCPESGASALHKESILQKRFSETDVTRAFTGKRARGFVNAFFISYDKLAPSAYPHIHYMTKPIRAKATQMNNSEYASLWTGTGFTLAKELPAHLIVEELVQELNE
ncbi:nitronate monooxygenase [Priestia megaterium]|uniref:nitronate monooxygenase n=1 Tax=Priestia megaterium TaxID=1404 RepID=UPI000D517FA8|nr:nitronate monooxygenase [Priestia megaterium]PVE66980.1 2-nitropropane dioxygenase [Priestia megaterium]PVE80397.1 2-nitropropane dioxygenase [Priestia megaterium]PVE86547.1 2-nitropropane dioxygenase [Priestia megaterium]PVF00121.1 2-nitropropane dioxygenase [Priestia megaterium]